MIFGSRLQLNEKYILFNLEDKSRGKNLIAIKAIKGNQRQSKAIKGNQRQSKAINGNH